MKGMGDTQRFDTVPCLTQIAFATSRLSAQ